MPSKSPVNFNMNQDYKSVIVVASKTFSFHYHQLNILPKLSSTKLDKNLSLHVSKLHIMTRVRCRCWQFIICHNLDSCLLRRHLKLKMKGVMGCSVLHHGFGIRLHIACTALMSNFVHVGFVRGDYAHRVLFFNLMKLGYFICHASRRNLGLKTESHGENCKGEVRWHKTACKLSPCP